MSNPRNTQFNPFDEQPCRNHSSEGPGQYDPNDGPGFGHGPGRGHGGGHGGGRGPGGGGRGSDGGGRGGGGRGGGGGGGGRRGEGRGRDAFDEASDGTGPEGMRRGPGKGHGRGRGFGPRGPRRAGRGDVRLAILSLLNEAPSNGYGLITKIAERTGNAWRPSSGSVYPTLQQLVDEQLIVASGDGRGTEYELTEAGRTYVQENESAITGAWAQTPGRSASDVAFYESVTKLKGVIHQFRLAGTDEQRAAATEKIDEVRRALYLILAD